MDPLTPISQPVPRSHGKRVSNSSTWGAGTQMGLHLHRSGQSHCLASELIVIITYNPCVLSEFVCSGARMAIPCKPSASATHPAICEGCACRTKCWHNISCASTLHKATLACEAQLGISGCSSITSEQPTSQCKC